MFLYMETTTATSPYRSLTVTVSPKGQVRTTTGVFLGEQADMENLGWEFN